MSPSISGAIACGQPVGDPAHGPANSSSRPRPAAVHQEERGGVVGDPAEVGRGSPLGLRAAVGGVGGGLGDRREQPVADLVEQRPVQLALGLEVLVQHGLGDAGRLGDVVHRGVVVAGPGEDLEGDVEELLAAGGGREAGRHRPTGLPRWSLGVRGPVRGRPARPP